MLRDVIRPLIPRRLRHWHRMRIDLAYRAKSAWTAELERLRALPRYRSATTEMLGYRVEIPDTASFLEMYDEIFVREIFAFRSDRPAPRIIDGGANIGLVTLYYKRTFPDARVVAFEPDNAIYAVLTRNIEHWGLANVELHRAALAAEEKTLRFMSEGSYAGRVAREGRSGQRDCCGGAAATLARGTGRFAEVEHRRGRDGSPGRLRRSALQRATRNH